jgi:hypothetical protein
MNIPAHLCEPQEESQLRQAVLVWLKQIPVGQLPRLTFGQIEPDSLEISLLSLQRSQATLEVALQFWFRETLAGSSCGFEASPDAGYAEATLVMDCAAGTAQFR